MEKDNHELSYFQGRMKATDTLRQRGKEMVRKGNGLIQLANQLDAIERTALEYSKAEGEGTIPYVGVGSAAEIALWELAQVVR